MLKIRTFNIFPLEQVLAANCWGELLHGYLEFEIYPVWKNYKNILYKMQMDYFSWHFLNILLKFDFWVESPQTQETRFIWFFFLAMEK